MLQGFPPERDPSTLRVHQLGGTSGYFDVPSSRVHQIPAGLAVCERLVLCPAYDPSLPATSCLLGPRCRHVHADVRNLRCVGVHVNYAWRSLDEVNYTRHEPGQLHSVCLPNGHHPTDVVDSGCLLVTKALQAKRRPLTHCAHYYFNRQCNLGADCRFVHAVFVDNNAPTLRRAPAPVQLTRGASTPEQQLPRRASHSCNSSMERSELVEGGGDGNSLRTPNAAQRITKSDGVVSPSIEGAPYSLREAQSPDMTTPITTPTLQSRGSAKLSNGGGGGGRQHMPYHALPVVKPIPPLPPSASQFTY
jgi:hypothetical protein